MIAVRSLAKSYGERQVLSDVNLDQVDKATFISTSSDTLDRAEEELGDPFHVIPGSIPMPGGSNGEIAMLGDVEEVPEALHPGDRAEPRRRY